MVLTVLTSSYLVKVVTHFKSAGLGRTLPPAANERASGVMSPFVEVRCSRVALSFPFFKFSHSPISPNNYSILALLLQYC